MSNAQDEEIVGKAYDRRLMRRLLGYVRPYRGQVVLATLAAVLHSGAAVIGPFLNEILIDRYLVPGRTAARGGFLHPWLPRDPVRGITVIALLYIVALLLGFVLDFVQTYIMQWVGQHSMFDLRRDLFQHLQRLQVAFFDQNPVGRMVTRVTNDVEVLNDMIASALVAFFDDSFVLVFIIVILFRYDWRLALITLSVLPLIGVAAFVFRRAVRDSYRRMRAALARINAFLQEHITGMMVVQVFNREQQAQQEFRDINRAHRTAWIDAIFAHAVYYPVVDILSNLAVAGILWWGGLRVLHGELKPGIVVAFILYAQRFFRPIQDLSEKYNLMQSAMASSERIFKLLDTPVTLSSPAQSSPVSRLPGRIEFDHVWFAYQNEEWVLQDVSFAIEPGSTVAVVGHTGAGKTTLISLLLRFYDVQRGAIRLDGADLRQLDLRQLRRRFGVVLQDPYLFSGPVAHNIRLGESGISDEAILHASRSVNLHEFIEELPQGYDTVLRERGNELSTGQKQLVNFARALAPQPPYLILDEATSSVDTDTELRIRAALNHLVRDRTSIIIAHRLSTIQRADQILVMHKGRLREQGTHQELLRQRGIYWRLYRLQYKDQETGAAPTVAPTTSLTSS